MMFILEDNNVLMWVKSMMSSIMDVHWWHSNGFWMMFGTSQMSGTDHEASAHHAAQARNCKDCNDNSAAFSKNFHGDRVVITSGVVVDIGANFSTSKDDKNQKTQWKNEDDELTNRNQNPNEVTRKFLSTSIACQTTIFDENSNKSKNNVCDGENHKSNWNSSVIISSTSPFAHVMNSSKLEISRKMHLTKTRLKRRSAAANIRLFIT